MCNSELTPDQWKILAHTNSFEGYKVKTIPIQTIMTCTKWYCYGLISGIVLAAIINLVISKW
jgi:hypothetical protein